jgi:hypothetical protein
MHTHTHTQHAHAHAHTDTIHTYTHTHTHTHTHTDHEVAACSYYTVAKSYCKTRSHMRAARAASFITTSSTFVTLFMLLSARDCGMG